MTFEAMYGKLIQLVRERVSNGELSESRLARITGVSQPHIHNVLKGVRVLTTELADQILHQLRINAEDLCGGNTVNYGLPFAPVPLLTGTLGPGMPEFQPNRTTGTVLVPAAMTTASVRQLVAAKVGEDAHTEPRFQGGDLVLIDQSFSTRTQIVPEGAYIVCTPAGPRIRYARLGGTRVYFPSERSIECPAQWEAVSLQSQSLADLVRGRIVWVSRHLEDQSGLGRIASR